ncbi:MocR-like transcription factor YczR [Actinomadura madurae]|uniref:MocR-like transcription factor YczR n=3 Tax=Actinomadura madurae TaxID=1993 RepID=UPI0020D21427|nr:PLP-dependent aminotransferase family protein [Actinomadura madurae]MCP9947891.1 PLP-dependent aminotransferase family protein [Actinomadura madurae]MCP9964665.1 PLP-dependent aminotransferase family protein [Actinomadura madurae]MCP9977136.1 PLP-dependent aminotransferase family protein [Actinomadura madurae]
MSTRYVSGPNLARLLGDLSGERPVYAALARAVRGLVLDGRLALRTRLPAERDLAAALGVSRTTVTTAYDRLRDEGYIESRQGAGSWTALPPVRMSSAGEPAPPGGAVPAGRRYGMAHPTPDDPSFIDLGCAAPGAPAVFGDAVAAAVAELPRHSAGPGYEPAGLAGLRQVIADGYTARGVPTRADQIVVTTGAQHAFTLLTQLLVEAGDAVMVERPTYPHALGALRRRGARLVPVGVNEGWDVELLAGAMRQAAVRMAYLIPDFQNPTGYLMSADERAALVDAARRADAFLVADETFADLAHDPRAPREPPLASFDAGGRVVTIGSASKLLWGGLRIGWIRATAPLARRLVLAREPFDMASPVLDQLIVRELLLRVEEVRAERAETLLRSRDALAGALRELLPGWDFRLPAGGMSLWARIGAPVASRLAEASERLGVRVVAGPVFGADGVLEDYVRLPYVLPPDTLRQAAERIALAFREVEAAPAARPLPAYV